MICESDCGVAMGTMRFCFEDYLCSSVFICGSHHARGSSYASFLRNWRTSFERLRMSSCFISILTRSGPGRR